MKKLVVLAGLVAVALLLGVAGTAVRSNDVQAKPSDIIGINPNVCVALIIDDVADHTALDLNGSGASDSEDDAIFVCHYIPAVVGSGLGVEANLAEVADILGGDVNDPDTYADMTAYSGSPAQLGENGDLWVLTFVTNDQPVTLDADEGLWALNGLSSIDCGTLADEDCNDDGVKGDGVVPALLEGAGVADRGDAQVDATQAGVDVLLDYTVVGDPDDITLAAVPDETVQEGYDSGDCEDLDLADFTDDIAEPEVNGLAATVVDDDGTELAGIPVAWESDDTDVANLNRAQTTTLATDAGTFAPNYFCGDETGTATIDASIDENGDEAIQSSEQDDDIDVTVIGAPDAMTLTASPASITCDGVTSSTVSADLVDSDGNKVVDGTDVRFEVVALGIADPITATTAGGSATSTITPLSGVSAGVVVLVTVPDADLEANIRIDCAPAAPPVAPPPVVPTGPAVVPPGTGDGGYLP
jgi:hypothetical protein